MSTDRVNIVWTGARKPNGVGKVRIGGRLFTTTHVAWERAHGLVPGGMRVKSCEGAALSAATTGRRRRSQRPRVVDPAPAEAWGSKRQISPEVWKLSVSAGHYEDGSLGSTTAPSTQAPRPKRLASSRYSLRAEQAGRDRPTVDYAIEPFLTEHLQGEKGREQRTVDDCRRLDLKWFSLRSAAVATRMSTKPRSTASSDECGERGFSRSA